MTGWVGDSTLGFATRLLHVRRAEMDRTFQVTAIAVVLGWGMMTGFNATQAIFLARAGVTSLPVFFIYLALSVWPMAALLGKLTQRIGVSGALRQVLIVNAVVAIFLYLVYEITETGPVTLAAYVIYSVGFEMVMLQFWTFVSEHFNLLEGKRIFPIVAAGSSIGYILAGVTTSYMAATVSTEALMFVWAAGTTLAALLVLRLEGRLFRPAPEGAEAQVVEAQLHHRRSGAVRSLATSLRFLASSRLLAALVVAAALTLVMMRVSDYLVARLFVAATRGNLQELTVLIGNAWSISYVVQLLLGLFLTPLILSRAGVKNAILVLPAASLAGFIAVALSPGLLSALFLFVVRNGVATGIDEPAANVLSGALPDRLRPPLRQILDDLVLPGSAIAGGIALIVVQGGLSRNSSALLALAGSAAAVLLIVAALAVRGLYLGAIYERLRTRTVSLKDFVRAIGSADAGQLDQLKTFIADEDPRVRSFAAAALGKLAPDDFGSLVPQLVVSPDPGLRRLAYQMAPPGFVSSAMLEAAWQDRDPWVAAAAAIAGHATVPPWPRAAELLEMLGRSQSDQAAAAAVWAASFIRDDTRVLSGFGDPRPRVRLEAIRSFAKMKGEVPGAATPLIGCLRDTNAEVRREAFRQAIRWTPPAAVEDGFGQALVEGLSSSDGVTRRLASEALAVQYPAALARTLPLLHVHHETGVTTVEALLRSGRPELVHKAEHHLVDLLDGALQAAHATARLRRLTRDGREQAADASYAALRLALENYQIHAVEMAMAALRAHHSKRGFATVERGLRSEEAGARAEALETLLNFGPGWLVEPLVQLLDPGSFETGATRPLSEQELRLLERHPDAWVMQAARLVREGVGASVADLRTLARVPVFERLTLQQLGEIDRLMVTRRHAQGESIFRIGEVNSDLHVVVAGEVRVHRDAPGRKSTLDRIGAGMYIGELALFDDRPRAVGVEAITDCELRVLRRESFEALAHEQPQILLTVVDNLSRRVRNRAEEPTAITPSLP